jgi:hypothetical protein
VRNVRNVSCIAGSTHIEADDMFLMEKEHNFVDLLEKPRKIKAGVEGRGLTVSVGKGY